MFELWIVFTPPSIIFPTRGGGSYCTTHQEHTANFILHTTQNTKHHQAHCKLASIRNTYHNCWRVPSKSLRGGSPAPTLQLKRGIKRDESTADMSSVRGLS